jgi:FkbM family methyltransferase
MIDHLMRSVKEAIKWRAYAHGYVVQHKSQLASRMLAERLRSIFADYDINTVIDVGANEGQFAEFLRHNVGFKGKIESFEPIPSLAQNLMAKATADGNWMVHQIALGARPGSLPFNVTKNPVMSSFRRVADNFKKEIIVEDIISVTVSTLDEKFFDKIDLRHTYLKLDTQGFDLEVLKGGTKSITDIPALQTEVSVQPYYKDMPGYKESIAAFERYGFVIADFFLVAVDKHAAMEFDCLMIRHPTE